MPTDVLISEQRSRQIDGLWLREPQQFLQTWFLGTLLGFPGDQPVQRGLPADDSQDEFMAKSAVSG